MLAAPWYCDSCGRQNSSIRYQCQQCRGFNTYDLCEMCIGKAQILHPNHTFQLVQQAVVVGSTMPTYTVWTMPQYTVPMWPWTTTFPKVKVTYEYSTG